MYDYKDDNKVIVGIIVIGFVILTAWICHDIGRNKPVYNDTNNTMERIENRINSIEQRVNSMSDRLAETQKTVNAIGGRIESSGKLAGEIADGIGSAETRLDDAIQRSGRIQNLISDIEAANR